MYQTNSLQASPFLSTYLHRMYSNSLLVSVSSGSVLNGTWNNQLGSSVGLEEYQDGRLVGHYNTGVESKPGAAGKNNRKFTNLTWNILLYIEL